MFDLLSRQNSSTEYEGVGTENSLFRIRMSRMRTRMLATTTLGRAVRDKWWRDIWIWIYYNLMRTAINQVESCKNCNSCRWIDIFVAIRLRVCFVSSMPWNEIVLGRPCEIEHIPGKSVRHVFLDESLGTCFCKCIQIITHGFERSW
jgi:hypothetical protein